MYVYVHNFVSLYERTLKLFWWTVNVKTLVKVNIFIIGKFTNQQRLEIIKNYYRNSESVVATLRALTPISGRDNRPTRQAVRAIVDEFETKFTLLDVLVPKRRRIARSQCSQNVDVNGPHHGPYQLMASSSLHCHRLVEWGRHNELEASIVGSVYVHVLRTLLEVKK